MGSSKRAREGNFRLVCGRTEMDAFVGLFRSMAFRSALPRIFSAAVFSGAVLSASVEIEHKDAAVFALPFSFREYAVSGLASARGRATLICVARCDSPKS